MTSISKFSSEFKIMLCVIFSGTLGFCIGIFGNLDGFLPEEPISPNIISVIKFTKIEGDEIFFETIGNLNVVWPGKKANKDETITRVPIGQIPTKNDLELRKFSYLGNAKTKKFYPTYTYPARGTDVKYRRFFQTKDEAIKAGFIASKLVK